MAVTKKTTAAETTAAVKTAKAAAPVEAAPAAPAKKAEAEAPKKEAAPKKTAAAKKEAAPKKAAAPAKETVKKAPAKKAPAKKEAKVFVEFAGRQFLADEIVEKAKAAYVAAGHTAAGIKTIEVYVKPEENVAYYVVNGEGSDDWKVSLD